MSKDIIFFAINFNLLYDINIEYGCDYMSGFFNNDDIEMLNDMGYRDGDGNKLNSINDLPDYQGYSEHNNTNLFKSVLGDRFLSEGKVWTDPTFNDSFNNEKYKFNTYIEMLNGSYEIKKLDNDTCFEGTDIIIGDYFKRNKDQIVEFLFTKEANNKKYDVAREKVNNYFTIRDTRFNLYIKLLLTPDYKIAYDDVNTYFPGTSVFVHRYFTFMRPKIEKFLYEDKKDDPTYDIARGKISDYELSSSVKIGIYANMLNDDYEITFNDDKGTVFTGTNVEIGLFWANHRKEIINYLFIDKLDDPAYSNARKKVSNHITKSHYSEKQLVGLDLNDKIKVYCQMLNNGLEVCFNDKEHTFAGTDVVINRFYYYNRDQIYDFLFNVVIDDPTYDIARMKVDSYNKKYGRLVDDVLKAKQKRDSLLQIQESLDERINDIEAKEEKSK